MIDNIYWIAWAIVYAVIGGVVGTVMVLLSSTFLPRIIARLSPNIDEEKEILRGNQAVAQYFGRVVAGGIIGISIVVAAAILGALIAALHGG